MTIKREDLDAGRIDFSDVLTGRRLPLIHPGEILRDDFLQPMKISVDKMAEAIKVPRSRVNDAVLGRRGISADTAFRLARYFGTTPDFWINLQARHDLEAADRKLRRRIEREVRPRAACRESKRSRPGRPTPFQRSNCNGRAANPSRPASNRAVSAAILPFVYQEVRRL